MNGVGAEAEDNGLSPKTPKVTDETKEAEPKMQFGNLPPVDTVTEEKGADDAGDSADHHMSADRDNHEDPARRGELKVTDETKEADAESNEMTDGKAGGMTVGKESADGAGVSADHNMIADRVKDDKDGELSPEEMVKMAEEAEDEAAKRAKEADGKAGDMAVEESADVAHGAHVTTGAEGEDPARHVEPSDPALGSSEGGSSSSDPAGPAGPALGSSDNKEDADDADGADGADGDEVNPRKLDLDSDDSDAEGSGDKTDGKTGGQTGGQTGDKTDDKTTGGGAESDDLHEDTDDESASGVSADHCATLNIAHGSSKNEIMKAFHKLSLRHHPDKNLGDKEGADERFKKVNEAKDFLLEAALKARRKADKAARKKEEAMAVKLRNARNALEASNTRKATEASNAWKARQAEGAREARKADQKRKAERKAGVAGAAAAGMDGVDDADGADDADAEGAADSDDSDEDSDEDSGVQTGGKTAAAAAHKSKTRRQTAPRRRARPTTARVTPATARPSTSSTTRRRSRSRRLPSLHFNVARATRRTHPSGAGRSRRRKMSS